MIRPAVSAAGSLFLTWALFDVPIRGSLLWLAVVTLLFLAGGLGWGIFISTLAETQQLAFQLSLLSSMLPTLLVGDYLFVSKFSYGYSRYSLPLSPDLFEGRIFSGEPERGDVVVFKLPRDNKTDYIKRIVGLPGDRIQVRQYIETLPNGREHLIWEKSDSDFLDNTTVYVVPDGHYFAMGDNRDSSQDSRVLSAVGYIPHDNLVGRAEVLFFSKQEGSSMLAFWEWPETIRWERIFNGIE